MEAPSAVTLAMTDLVRDTAAVALSAVCRLCTGSSTRTTVRVLCSRLSALRLIRGVFDPSRCSLIKNCVVSPKIACVSTFVHGVTFWESVRPKETQCIPVEKVVPKRVTVEDDQAFAWLDSPRLSTGKNHHGQNDGMEQC